MGLEGMLAHPVWLPLRNLSSKEMPLFDKDFIFQDGDSEKLGRQSRKLSPKVQVSRLTDTWHGGRKVGFGPCGEGHCRQAQPANELAK
jgi:hypothetical protein